MQLALIVFHQFLSVLFTIVYLVRFWDFSKDLFLFLMKCTKIFRVIYPSMRIDINLNKTLHGALTCWGYTNTHMQLFQLRFKVLPQLSGKVENERERLNTVLKCGRAYPHSFFKTVSRQLVRTLGLNCALKRSK